MNEIISWTLLAAGLGGASIWLSSHIRRRPARTAARDLARPGRASRSSVPIIYTAHVKQRMAERAVQARQIELVIAEPTREVHDARNSSVRLEREVGGRILIVWVAQPWPTTEAIYIKSTAWTDCVLTFDIPGALAGRVIGRGGRTVRQIEAANDVRISVDGTGSVRVSARHVSSAESARQQVLTLIDSATAFAVA